MARIRTVKPEFFKHYDLWEAEQESGFPLRVAFAGLWTVADREGRFEWKPPQLKIEALPYDDVDFSRVLDALATRGFIVRYRVNGRDYGYIPSWHKHQVINNRERASDIPKPPDSAGLTREARVDDASTTREVHALAEGNKEGKGKEYGEASASGDDDWTSDVALYRRGKAVLGDSRGATITQLKDQCGDVFDARRVIETAAEKDKPLEYVNGAIQRRRKEAKQEARRNPANLPGYVPLGVGG